jgi:hypothetical protein
VSPNIEAIIGFLKAAAAGETCDVEDPIFVNLWDLEFVSAAPGTPGSGKHDERETLLTESGIEFAAMLGVDLGDEDNGDDTTTLTVVIPSHRRDDILHAIETVLKEPDAPWFRELKSLYEDCYEGLGGLAVMAQDLGVSKTTLCNWRFWPRMRAGTGTVIEPTHQNREVIRALWRSKLLVSDFTEDDAILLAKAKAISTKKCS